MSSTVAPSRWTLTLAARLRTVTGCGRTRVHPRPGPLTPACAFEWTNYTRPTAIKRLCSAAAPGPREDTSDKVIAAMSVNGETSRKLDPTGSRAGESVRVDQTLSGRWRRDNVQGTQELHPSLIIIFGWLGAKPPHVRKYADAYRRMYPSSVQLIINSDPLRFWKPLSVRERALEKAVQDIAGHLSNMHPGNPPRILLHVMSNGGACSLVDLASVLRKKCVEAPAESKCAVVFDSSPAPVTFAIMNRAFTASIRGRLRRYLAMFLVSAVYVVTLAVRAALRLPAKPMERELTRLNDPSLLPWTSTRTPRMYLYSSGDRIVPASGVEGHAAGARAAGFPVRMVHFGQSGHVAHARDDPEKYWSAVRSFWEEASR